MSPSVPPRTAAQCAGAQSGAYTGAAGNLPSPITAFFGREHDVQSLDHLLSDASTRIITITGTGGIGKTRLAIEVARRHCARYNDGIWFFDLQSTRLASEIASIIAEAVRIPLSAERSVLDQVVAMLANRRSMLIFDNCEQIADAAQVIGFLLRQAPLLTVIATSRSPLYIPGERLYNLKPLPVPDGESFDALAQCDSVRLFEQRARDTCHEWQLTPENAGVVSAICQRLEGLPLCIELAAARLRNMTPQEILVGLADRFRLLSSPSTDIPASHRTLRAMIDWSYLLLRNTEQEFFVRLALFPGGFFSETVETVTGNPCTRDILGTLCDASLLARSAWQNRTRYQWLESIREYAEEKLQRTDPGELADLHVRHAEYYLAIARTYTAQLRSPSESQSIAECALEFPNLRRAFDWSREHHPAYCAQFAGELHALMVRRGQWDEAMDWSEHGLRAARQLNDTESEGALLLNLASTLYDRGEMDDAGEHVETALALFRDSANPIGEARAVNLIGLIAYERGDDATAATWLEEALAISVREHDRALEGIILHNLGVVSQHRQNSNAAMGYYHRASAIRQELGDQRGIAETRNNIGVLALDELDVQLAAAAFSDCLEASRTLGDEVGIALALHNLGEVAAHIERLDYALPLLVMAAQRFRRLGSALASASENFTRALCDRHALEQDNALLTCAKATPYAQVVALASDVAALIDNKPDDSRADSSGND
ncbi:MAG: ATP-binding protein [Armatimonadota bacterium]